MEMTLSDKGRKLLLDYEVGGGEPYYRKFLSRPTWPGEQSGVTIGVGFDLGYNSESQVGEAWGTLSNTSLELLMGAIGIRGESARLWLSSRPMVRDIEVPWEKALDVFERITVPRFYLQLLRIYPQAETLPEPARDALLSLVFNRGTALAGDRRAEMLGIQNALRDGRTHDVPQLHRSMKRLWPNTTGLQKRRDAEADLFESAL
jgi:hypothetical protein